MYFLDTNICIYALNGRFPEIQEHISRKKPNLIKIPSIVKAELYLGAEKSNNLEKTKNVLKRFLSPFEVVPFCDKCSFVYAKLRSQLETDGTLIGPNDLIIASIVLGNKGILVTHNLKEFSRVRKLETEDWTLKA